MLTCQVTNVSDVVPNTFKKVLMLDKALRESESERDIECIVRIIVNNELLDTQAYKSLKNLHSPRRHHISSASPYRTFQHPTQ